MRYIPRHLEAPLKKAAKHFPAIILTGPRRAGKTTLLRRAFPKAEYYLLEDPDLLGRVRSDPRSFLEFVRPPVILDEIQNAPELFSYVRTRIDRSSPRRPGQWMLTGSQDAALMRGVTESMAGRAAVFDLLPLSRAEAIGVGILTGGYPEVLAAPKQAETWFRSYVQTYLERDVRQMSAVRDLATFRRFLALLASRTGQMVNRSDLAGALGMSVPTVSAWLGILEATKQILLIPPYFENFGKRLVKSPKLYFADSGLTCHLLGISSENELRKSVFAGPIFEGFVASEVVKRQLGAGHRQELYYFRDRQGLEVDFLIPRGSGRVTLLEVKASRTVRPEMAQSMQRLSKAMSPCHTACAVVHWPSQSATALDVLALGVRAVPVDRLADVL
jgi:predicted AAA+ superfamily ATPase